MLASIILLFSLLLSQWVQAISFSGPTEGDINENLALHWSNLTAAAKYRNIFNVQSGSAKGGRLLGVLGPSGCGKTTFLRTISSQIEGSLSISGEIFFREKGSMVDVGTEQVAYVHQDDSFFPMLSVRETLTLAAELKRISDAAPMGQSEAVTLNDQIEHLISALSLDKVADSLVGSSSTGSSGGKNGKKGSGGGNRRGISGGERKRLSVACEMLGSPKLLIADEPTSGLDSFQALQVVQLLHDLAKTKNIISICTIHQPRSRIWNLLDDVMILTPSGRLAYHGERARVLEYFEGVGFPCPANTNPAEHFIDLVSVDTSTPSSVEQSHQRIRELETRFSLHHQRRKSAAISPSAMKQVKKNDEVRSSFRRSGPFGMVKRAFGGLGRCAYRCSLLYQRSLRQVLRDLPTSVVRISISAALALVIGAVFGVQGPVITPDTVANRVNVVAQAVINVAMLSMINTLQVFKKEKTVIDRERSHHQYSAAEYLFSKSFAELPLDALVAACFAQVLHQRTLIRCDRGKFVGTVSLLGAVTSSLGLAVGALCPSGEMALSVGPALMVVYLIMGTVGPAGVGQKSLPWVLTPFRYFSPMKWACEALCDAEFRGAHFDVARSTFENQGRLKTFLQASSHVTKGLFKTIAKNTISRGALTPIEPTDGDFALAKLGIPDASHSTAIGVMWRMLAGHLGLALVGLWF